MVVVALLNAPHTMHQITIAGRLRSGKISGEVRLSGVGTGTPKGVAARFFKKKAPLSGAFRESGSDPVHQALARWLRLREFL